MVGKDRRMSAMISPRLTKPRPGRYQTRYKQWLGYQCFWSRTLDCSARSNFAYVSSVLNTDMDSKWLCSQSESVATILCGSIAREVSSQMAVRKWLAEDLQDRLYPMMGFPLINIFFFPCLRSPPLRLMRLKRNSDVSVIRCLIAEPKSSHVRERDSQNSPYNTLISY